MIVLGTAMAQSVSFVSGEVVAVVFRTCKANKVGELEEVREVAASNASAEVAKCCWLARMVDVARLMPRAPRHDRNSQRCLPSWDT